MITFIHLYNDYSGSPKVLFNAIKAVAKKKKVKLYIGSSGNGVLDKLEIEQAKYPYTRSKIKILTFIFYLYSQVALFFGLLLDKSTQKNSIIYINTLLPFGAAVYGKLTKKKVIYHLHEVSLSPQLLKNILIWICKITAKELIYVSKFHKEALNIKGPNNRVIYNSINWENQQNIGGKHFSSFFNITILSSLRDYKGIPEFLDLSSRFMDNAKFKFHIVPNANNKEVEEYFKNYRVPKNCEIHQKSNNVIEHYKYSNLVLNLSRPNEWIETFGLTLVEALSLGIPVIAPSIGGPLEIVKHGYNGFLINSYDLDQIVKVIYSLEKNTPLYEKMSKNAIASTTMFSHSNFERNVIKLIETL